MATRKVSLFILCVALVTTGATVHSLPGDRAEEVGSDVMDTREIAKEAFIYAYPMLYNYKTLYQQAVDNTFPGYIGGFNRFRHYARNFTPDDTDIVTPNNDTPYSWAWLDLRAEPIVVSVPAVTEDRYYVMQFVDLYTHNFAYVGVRATGFGAGNYLFAGPGWDGDVPEGIDDVFRSESSVIMTLTRTSMSGPEDAPNVKTIQEQYKLTPLSAFTGKPAPAPAPAIDFPEWDEEKALSPDFIGYLNFLLQFVEPHPSEKELLARFGEIGIGPGKPLDASTLSPDDVEAIGAGVADARKALEDEIKTRIITLPTSAEYFGTREFLKNDYISRAGAAAVGIYGNSQEEAIYISYQFDADGKPCDGNINYVIRFDAGKLPPVKFFWSATMYDLPDRQLVNNPLDRYAIGDKTSGLKYGDDGSLEIYLQHESPGAEKESNWLPTPAGPFFMVVRLYGPEQEILDGTWAAPPITKVQ